MHSKCARQRQRCMGVKCTIHLATQFSDRTTRRMEREIFYSHGLIVLLTFTYKFINYLLYSTLKNTHRNITYNIYGKG